jgi:hypothetical protein
MVGIMRRDLSGDLAIHQLGVDINPASADEA